MTESYQTAKYNEWFISAIKSSKHDGELQERKLLQNCANCSNQVKAFIEANEKNPSLKYEEFRLNSTILLLLGCPTVNSIPEISFSEDFIPVIKSIPPLDNTKLFSVIKGLKNYKYLRGILPFLPVKVPIQLLSQFLNQNKSVTPLALAICFELFYAMIYSLQCEEEELEIVRESLDAFQAFMKSINVEFDSDKNIKLRGYHFMYAVEAVQLLMCILEGLDIKEPETTSLGLKFKTLTQASDAKSFLSLNSVLKNAVFDLLTLCNSIVQQITSNIWISWHEIYSPSFGISLPLYEDSSIEKKSIQMQIACTAFKTLKILQNKSKECSINIGLYNELLSFMNNVAIDPLYDPDVDLSNSDLVDAIKSADSSKCSKLLAILLNRDDVFSSEKSLKCVKEQQDLIKKSEIYSITTKVIEKINTDEVLWEWKRVVVDLCKKLTQFEVLNIIDQNLNGGASDCLKTPEFMQDLTQIFNQLSDHPEIECYESYVWLCLQSGLDVVRSSVQMTLSLPGLVPVMAQGLRIIYNICRNKTVHDVSYLTYLINENLDSNLTAEMEKELLNLVLNLLQEPLPMIEGGKIQLPQDVCPVDVSEMMEKVVFPRLKWETGANQQLVFLINTLKAVMETYPEAVLNCEKFLPPLLASLALIYHNSCSLLPDNLSQHLTLRNDVEFILKRIIEELQKNTKAFNTCRECTLTCLLLHQYNLHPRCVHLLSPLIGQVEVKNVSYVDEVFSLVLQKTYPLNRKTEIPNCTRTEWIWALFKILPDCDKEEWITSLYLTHAYLGPTAGATSLIMPVLKIFQEVFILLCDEANHVGDEYSCNHFSLQHCFKSFSSSAVMFVSDFAAEDEKPFYTLVNLFTWWCLCLKTFDCDPELPYLFLYSFCSAMNDLIKSKAVVIKTGKTSKSASPKQTEISSELTAEQELENTGIKELNPNSEHISEENSRAHPENRCPKSPDLNGYELSKAVVRDNPQIVKKEKFSSVMDYLVKKFVETLIPNKIASAIAGKLKTMCEL